MVLLTITAQNMKFSVADFSSKCDQTAVIDPFRTNVLLYFNTFSIAEAATRRCSVKKMFLKMSQNS